ncbi:hypothetical protein LEMA_P119770.1 [Paecilomyces variotii No. 5]|uniref:Uncharacterized protein n=1 Tax=Byssochlamys spectabilis (strain No. 5 / NBRC 109023) TaxID=1356009 RepID=V5FI93_BYSSN|nr:hypothetical protein LEMA_P119770.1 [Paecilomyces variotii No. 5]
MRSNKSRFYVSLYFRSGQSPPDSYHWALLVGPKHDEDHYDAMQYHVKNTIQPGVSGQPWVFEASRLGDSETRFRLLTRVLIAKIGDPSSVDASLRSVPVVQGDPDFNCISWVRSVIETLDAHGVLSKSKVVDWSAIDQRCRNYVAKKKAAGRWRSSPTPDSKHRSVKIPTWDMLQERETVS